MKRSVVVLAAASVLLLSACGSPAPAADVAGPATMPATSSAPAPRPGFDAPVAFGQTVKFPSGVEATVSAVSFAPPGKDVGVVGDGNQAVFALSIANNSSEKIDASKMSWPKVTYGALKSATPISNANITTMLPGDKGEDKFSRFIPAAEGGKVRVQVADPAGGDPAVFEGSISG